MMLTIRLSEWKPAVQGVVHVRVTRNQPAARRLAPVNRSSSRSLFNFVEERISERANLCDVYVEFLRFHCRTSVLKRPIGHLRRAAEHGSDAPRGALADGALQIARRQRVADEAH